MVNSSSSSYRDSLFWTFVYVHWNSLIGNWKDAVFMAKNEPDFIPTYAVIDKKPPPSPIKTDSRNNTLLKKQVTISPTVDQRGSSIPIQAGPPMHSPPPYGHPNPPYQGQGSNLQYQGQGSSLPYQGQGIHYEYAKPAQQVTYTFPMRSQQPTPYSTLTQRQPQSQMMHGQQGFNFIEDYDNTQEVTPMMHQQQKWRTTDDDLPEPQPLVYPSAKRPMTFEQTSSSKVSIYDNVQFGLDKIDD
ncbi:hypothetical protein KUTeg_009726 [Tegillarca granosa]|uniref:Uncharacterized protein n=1 Tax=Tegillarca granosa TaxID=220873 RepID=A0ABQ9F4Q4_TEGGR|nr:hypothetical protein KUTeg_009726 [Tegillarca granosa]